MMGQARRNNDPMAEELALLGHDIRSAISDLLAGLALIDDSPLRAPDRLQLDRSKATGESLLRLLEDGLNTLLAKAPPDLQRSPVELVTLIEDLMRRWGHSTDKHAAAVASRYGALPAAILCNKTALERVLSNLLSNAITHSAGKPVSFDITQPAPDALRFCITDQGPGFPEAMIQPSMPSAAAQIAFPAWETAQGHGLGLSIAQSLAVRIGARLTLRNIPSGGGMAELLLPVILPETSAIPAADIGDMTGKHVLIADDSTAQLLLLAQYVTEAGARVTMVRDGHAALAALEANQFDLMLVDLEMPGRGGLELCAALRAMPAPKSATSIAVLTAHSFASVHNSAIAAGADRVIVKPVTSPAHLMRALHETPAKAPSPTPDPAPDPRHGVSEPSGAPHHPIRPDALLHLLDMAGPDVADELLMRFEADLTAVQTQLQAALPGPDWAELRAASHVLIALAGTAGAPELEADARAFNLAANDADKGRLGRVSTAVACGLEALLGLIRCTARNRQPLG